MSAFFAGMVFAVSVGLMPLAHAGEAAATKAGCMACHAKDKKIIGPSFKDIGAKYKDDASALVKLSEKVRKGGVGVWGPIPMPPHAPDKISDDDLKSTLDWIMKGTA